MCVFFLWEEEEMGFVGLEKFRFFVINFTFPMKTLFSLFCSSGTDEALLLLAKRMRERGGGEVGVRTMESREAAHGNTDGKPRQ